MKTHLENICTLFSDMKCNVNKNNYLLQILVNVTGLHKSSLVQFRKKIMCHDPWTLHWRTLQHGLLELFKDQLKSKLDSLSEGVREVCDLYVCKELCERGEKPCNKISDYTLSLRLLFYFQPDKNALVVANLVFVNWILDWSLLLF